MQKVLVEKAYLKKSFFLVLICLPKKCPTTEAFTINYYNFNRCYPCDIVYMSSSFLVHGSLDTDVDFTEPCDIIKLSKKGSEILAEKLKTVIQIIATYLRINFTTRLK